MSLSFLLSTIYRRFVTLPTSVKDLSGGTVIITGANTGLGFEAAKSIYAMNPAHLILAVRSIPKGEEAKTAILSSITKDAPPGEDRRETKVDVWEVDLTDFESVKRFASRCERELDRLDILLENAGLVTKWLLTTDGWETMQVLTSGFH